MEEEDDWYEGVHDLEIHAIGLSRDEMIFGLQRVITALKVCVDEEVQYCSQEKDSKLTVIFY